MPRTRSQILPPDEPAPIFEGYSPATAKFLHGLKKNNNKPWFEEHRDDYEMHLRNPSRALVYAMGQRFRECRTPVVANVKASLFRINRDIRFSKDKSPYKTHVGLWFPYEAMKKDEWCGLYVGIEPGKKRGELDVFVGGGVYQPGSAQLKRLRATIAERHKELSRLLADEDFQEYFPDGLSGDSLVRMPVGYSEDHPAATLLKLKSFLFRSTLSGPDLYSEDLPDLLIARFAAARQVLDFLGKA